MTDHKKEEEEFLTPKQIRRKTIISFVVFFAFIVVAFVSWQWLYHQPLENGVQKSLRRGLEINEKVNGVFFSKNHLVKEFPVEAAAKKVRVNGYEGLKTELDTAWHLIIKRSGNATPLKLSMEDICLLPEKEIIFDFKCIEGWSQVSHWGGVSFADFLTKYKLGTHSGNVPDPEHPEDLYKYVGLMTPDSGYYVGIDMKSMMHPQTILAYQLNNLPLPLNQGFPLRLIIPVKYGVKHLKRIGYIYFSDTKPKDYWFERGYDYDSAL